MTRLTILFIIGAIGVLILAGIGVGMMWAQLGVTMSMHGWIAYGIGALASIALSVGLFWLTFHSARSGHDDLAHPEDYDG